MNWLLLLAIVLVVLWALARAMGWVLGAALNLLWIVALVFLVIWLVGMVRGWMAGKRTRP